MPADFANPSRQARRPTNLAILIAQARAGDHQSILTLLAQLDPLVRQVARTGEIDDLRQQAATYLLEVLADPPRPGDPPTPDGPPPESVAIAPVPPSQSSGPLVVPPAPASDAIILALRNRIRARLLGYVRAEARRRGQLVRLDNTDLGDLAARAPRPPVPLSPRLRSALQRLSPAQRAVIHKIYLEEQRLAEVAREIVRTPQEVSLLRQRALHRLRRDFGPPP